MSLQSKYEEYVKRNKLRPIKRYTYNGVSIYLAEGGPYFADDYPMSVKADLKKEFPIGWYEAVWAVGRDENIDIWQPLCFDYLHDMSLTATARTFARVNSAAKEAESVIDSNPQLFGRDNGTH